MKTNTDISSFLENGGKIKKGRVKRAKGAEQVVYYSVGPLPAVKKKEISIPIHFSKGLHEWERVQNEP